jgi:hypothetical protein
MSIVIDANYEGETFEVEIFRDGTIEFPDRDFQYEQAEAEFLPPGSVAVRFYNLWNQLYKHPTGSPLRIMLTNLDLQKDHALRFLADCSGHVLHFYEQAHDRDMTVRTLINMARKYIAGKIDLKTVATARKIVVGFVREAEEDEAKANFSSDEAAAAAAEWLGWVIEILAPSKNEWINSINARSRQAADHCVARARDAAAMAGREDENYGSSEWEKAYKNEALWQFRRFMDCMEAVGQDLPWPDLGVTS